MNRGPKTIALAVGVTALTAIFGGAAHALPAQRQLRAAPQHVISFEPPAGWERAATPPSSRLLATWSHHDGARLSFAAQTVAADVGADKLYAESMRSLEKQGWAITKADRQTGKVTVDASLDKGKRVARQIYLVESGFAYVITLVAPAEQVTERTHDLDDAMTGLKLGTSDDRK